MYILKTSASFDSAHFLADYNGKCANLHGHHWVIEIEVGRELLQYEGENRGMVIDFGDLKKEVRSVADSFDHAFIYEENSLRPETVKALDNEGFRQIPVPFRPTAENFAKHFYDILRDKGIPVLRSTVYETPDNCASYEVQK